MFFSVEVSHPQNHLEICDSRKRCEMETQVEAPKNVTSPNDGLRKHGDGIPKVI